MTTPPLILLAAGEAVWSLIAKLVSRWAVSPDRAPPAPHNTSVPTTVSPQL